MWPQCWLFNFLLLTTFRAHACLAWSDSHRDPAPAADPPVGATGIQPHPLSHLHLVAVLPLLNANRGQWRKQRDRQGMPVCGSQHFSLYPERPATLSCGTRSAGARQPRGQEGEQRGHLSDWRRQWVGSFIFALWMLALTYAGLCWNGLHLLTAPSLWETVMLFYACTEALYCYCYLALASEPLECAVAPSCSDNYCALLTQMYAFSHSVTTNNRNTHTYTDSQNRLDQHK